MGRRRVLRVPPLVLLRAPLLLRGLAGRLGRALLQLLLVLQPRLLLLLLPEALQHLDLRQHLLVLQQRVLRARLPPGETRRRAARGPGRPERARPKRGVAGRAPAAGRLHPSEERVKDSRRRPRVWRARGRRGEPACGPGRRRGCRRRGLVGPPHGVWVKLEALLPPYVAPEAEVPRDPQELGFPAGAEAAERRAEGWAEGSEEAGLEHVCEARRRLRT